MVCFQHGNRTVIEMTPKEAGRIASIFPDTNAYKSAYMGFDQIAVVVAIKHGVVLSEEQICKIYRRAMKKIAVVAQEQVDGIPL